MFPQLDTGIAPEYDAGEMTRDEGIKACFPACLLDGAERRILGDGLDQRLLRHDAIGIQDR
ncbi:hypothetical protein D3C71_1974810 [compost metagenome]